ncbi:protein kinase domain-containing protein [Singulisphaera sp. PoT]|uniref:WD40 repeat domain-containing serine/threonine protein kinase n=1 Tax=Singulisphaera sp. PoT TaxID=3411797 RepID=UPI003BF47158
MRACPADDLLLKLVDGELPEGRFAAIEAHVETCGACQAALERLGDTTEAGEWRRHNARNARPVTATLPPPLAPGAIGRLDCFDVLEELGGGAMGTVYRAHDTRLRRPVAIKVINPELAALPGFKQLFEREAHTAARVKDDHLVAIHHVSAGAADFPFPYLVMELIEGETLKHRLRRKGATPPREAAGIALHVAAGLAAIHGAGLVHRDIKPANILLDRNSRRARIADFGLARAIDVVEERMALTAGTPGTPAYMSPEQFASPGDVDGRSDLFSLGVVLYEMLTGRQPFPGQSPEAIALQVATASPAPPRSVNPNLPRDLETICLVCLDKDADHRFEDAAALAEDLKRFLRHEPILSRRPPLGRRIALFARRNRPLVRLASASLFLAAAVATSAWIVVSLERSKSRDSEGGRRKAVELADRKSKEAETRKQRELHTRYLVEIKDAWKAWKEDRPGEARSLLAQHLPGANPGLADTRGVEWFYLDRLLGVGVRSLSFEGKGIAACLSPDGSRVAALGLTEGEEYCVRIWKYPASRPERTLILGRKTNLLELDRSAILKSANLAGQRGVAFSPDGSKVAGACVLIRPGRHEGLLKVWEVGTGKPIFEASDAGLGERPVSFSRDGRHVLAGAHSYPIDAEGPPGDAFSGGGPGEGPVAGADPGTPDADIPFAHSPDRKWALARDDSPEAVRLLNIKGLEDRSRRSPFGPSLLPRARSAANPMTVIAFEGGDVKVAALADRMLAVAQEGGRATAAAILPTGELGARMPLRGHEGEITCLAFCPTIPRLVAAGPDAVTVWDSVLDPQELRPIREQNTGLPASYAAVAAPGPVYAAGRWECRVSMTPIGHPGIRVPPKFSFAIHDLARPDARPRMVDSPMPVGAVTINPNGTRLAISGPDDPTYKMMDRYMAGDRTRPPEAAPQDFRQKGVIFLLDIATGKTVRALVGGRHSPASMAFDARGERLISAAGNEPSIHLWDVEQGREIRELKLGTKGVARIDFSPDGRWIIAGELGGRVSVHDAETGEAAAEFQAEDKHPLWALHEDLLAVPVDGKRIKVWDMRSRHLVREMNDLGRRIEALAFLDAGRRLTSLGGQTLTLWTLETESEIFSISTGYWPPMYMPRIALALERIKSEAGGAVNPH